MLRDRPYLYSLHLVFSIDLHNYIGIEFTFIQTIPVSISRHPDTPRIIYFKGKVILGQLMFRRVTYFLKGRILLEMW
jgi:hypothetical protein